MATTLWREVEQGTEWELGQFTIIKESTRRKKCYRLEDYRQIINNFDNLRDAQEAAWQIGGFDGAGA